MQTEDKWYDFKWYNVHGCIFIFLWIVALTANLPFYNLEWHTLSTRYLLHKVPVHRHRDPLRMIVNGAHLPKTLKIAMETDLKDFNLKSKKQVREYIEDHVLSYSDVEKEYAYEHYKNLQAREFSPLQVTMFLMGCYGYAYNDRHTQNITQLLELPVWQSWSTPLLAVPWKGRLDIAIYCTPVEQSVDSWFLALQRMGARTKEKYFAVLQTVCELGQDA